MKAADARRLRTALAGCQESLTITARKLLVELGLCFTVKDSGKLAKKAYSMVAAIAHELGLPVPPPDRGSDRVHPAILEQVARLQLHPDDARAMIRCLLLVGVSRGALTGDQRKIVAAVAKVARIPTGELNGLAREALQEPAPLMSSSFAVISDIHSNIAALEAVFADIDTQGIERVICLGDVVGYGPDPLPCADLVRERCAFTLMGNHDAALFEGAKGFNRAAREAIEWTKFELLDPRRSVSQQVALARWEFLRQLPLSRNYEDDLFVHGSPRDPWREYIFPGEARHPKARKKFREIFASVARYLFVGHTHIPCVITDRGYVATSTQLNNTYRNQPGVKVIVNSGSVGQPRDRDARACYVIVDDDWIHWRRVEYPKERTVMKIEANPRLDPGLGLRLLKGV